MAACTAPGCAPRPPEPLSRDRAPGAPEAAAEGHATAQFSLRALALASLLRDRAAGAGDHKATTGATLPRPRFRSCVRGFREVASIDRPFQLTNCYSFFLRLRAAQNKTGPDIPVRVSTCHIVARHFHRDHMLLTFSITPLAVSRTRVTEHVQKAIPGEQLTVDLQSGGALQIRGSDENAVRVRAHVSGPDPLNVPVSLEPVSGGVRLHVTGAPGTSAAQHRFGITMPRNYNIIVNSAGGRLTITDVHGVMRGAVAGGMITIRRERGRAELSTTAGAVRVSDSDLEGSIKTGGGSVRLRRVIGSLRTEPEN